MTPPRIAAVILAAGASRRLGRPKQAIEIHGETLLARAVRHAREAGLDPVFVVLADPTLASLLQSTPATILRNPDASEGIASSIRIAIPAAREASTAGVVLMTCDQPALTASHLRALCAHPESAAASAYAGVTGIPAYLPASAFDDLLHLRGDQGARSLLRNARAVPLEALSLDVDTEEDLRRLRQLLQDKAFL